MRPLISKYPLLFIIILTSLILKLLLLQWGQNVPLKVDELDFWRKALEVEETGTFTGAWRAPVNCYLLGASARLFQRNLDYARLLQIVLSTLTVPFFFLLGREIFGIKTALWSSAIWAFFPEAVGFSHYIYSETPFLAFFIPTLYLLTLFAKEGKGRYLFPAGLLFGMSMLTRAIVLHFL